MSKPTIIQCGIQFEGTADEIAEKVFQDVIVKMFKEMAKNDPESARLFAFSIMWLGMGQYSSLFPPQNAKKSLQYASDQFCTILDGFYEQRVKS